MPKTLSAALAFAILAIPHASASAQTPASWPESSGIARTYDLSRTRILVVAAPDFNTDETTGMATCWRGWGATVEFAARVDPLGRLRGVERHARTQPPAVRDAVVRSLECRRSMMAASTSIYRSEAGRVRVLAAYDAVLAVWPVPLQTFTVATPAGATFVAACGSATAPPLVLLHGAGSNSGAWIGEVGRFAGHYRVLAVDLPGEPGRSAATRPPWRGPACADWTRAVLDALGIRAWTVVGSSLMDVGSRVERFLSDAAGA